MSLSAPDRPVSPGSAGPTVPEAVWLGTWTVAAGLWAYWYWRVDPTFGPLHMATAAGLVLALALLARRGWVRLFGPVLIYEGLRSARRTRFFLLRWLYAVGLLLLLLWVHWMWTLSNRYDAGEGTQAAYKQQAKLAEEYFYAFAIVQFVAVVLLTPAYVAGGIAEEKERKTLEFLLATDLRGREIVFGKLLARLGNLALFVLAGLPVLSLMQFFGGIDPGLLLASFSATALTACSLAALGTLLSVQRKRARDAIILTYLAAAGYAVIASLTLAVPPLLAEYRQAPTRAVSRTGTAPLPIERPAIDEWVESGVQWLNAGNPFYCLGRVIHSIDMSGRGGGGSTVVDEIRDVLTNYALFHVPFSIVCVTWAVARLRPIALAQAGSAPKAKRRRYQLVRILRPRLGSLPMLWKEVWVEGGLKFGWFGRILVALVVGISFVPLVIMVYILFLDEYHSARNYHHAWDQLGEGVNVWVRSVNAIVSSLMLVGVAVRAAGAVGGERDRDTLVSLMTTPQTTSEIFWAKWAGSMASVRLFLVWLGVVWAIGLATGGVGLWAVPMQVVFWLLPAAFVAGLGLYCSAACKTTLRATTWSILGTLVALGGHWVCSGMCCFLPLVAALSVRERNLEWLLQLEAGLSPPFVFAWLPYRETRDLRLGDAQFPAMIVLAQTVWMVGAIVAANRAHERFRQLTNRNDTAGGPRRPAARELPTVLPAVLPVDDDKGSL